MRTLAVMLSVSAVVVQAEDEWFDVTDTRYPGQCERMRCLSVRLEHCRDHLHGFSLREKPCAVGQGCTNCAYGNSTVPAICFCENPPYSIPVGYGQNCGMGMDCIEGFCFRPCGTFLHMTSCPTNEEGHCSWDAEVGVCVDRPAAVRHYLWLASQDGKPRPAGEEANDIVTDTSPAVFPMDFDYFRRSAQGYRINGILIDQVSSIGSLFQWLDVNNDGFLSATDYASLPTVLGRLEEQATQFNTRRLTQIDDDEWQARRLANASITPEVCNSMRPRQYYCSFDVSCKGDCRECGWKSATSTAFSACVSPSPQACAADQFKVFCESDQLCHDPGDCSNCADRPIVDHIQGKCMQLWWEPRPLAAMKDWVCRFRNKVGMPCKADMDCIYGMRRCLGGTCASFQPYNPEMTCVDDLDCPHLGYYCPKDPTGGANKYWVQYCREQGDIDMTCEADRECKPDLRCNAAESPGRCQRLFSLPIGGPASEDELCEYGWRDVDFKCAPPARSRQVGRPCDTNEDCTTTDLSGRTGQCVCKSWWETADPKYCDPTAGDYENHQEKLRNYLFFRAKSCGTFWTEEECLRVFGTQAMSLKLAIACEKQTLVGGPFLPGEECGLQDYDRFPDYCAQLR